MEKIEQIRVMLDYITNRKQSNFRRVSDGVFEDCYKVVKIDDIEYRSRSSRNITIDFNKKEIHWYAYEESYHNGDHFDCKSGNVPLDILENSYNDIRRLAISFLKEEVLKEEERLKAERIEREAEVRLVVLLGNN